MAEGDHVKVRAILVPESENRKNIRYLATSLVTAKSRRAAASMKLPQLEQLDNIDQIHPSKINNFYTVVSAVSLKDLLGIFKTFHHYYHRSVIISRETARKSVEESPLMRRTTLSFPTPPVLRPSVVLSPL